MIALRASPFRRSGAALLLVAVSGPVWKVIVVSLPGASLTVGRGLILLAILLLAFDRRAAAHRTEIPRPVWLLCAALGALWLWLVINTILVGCRCSDELAGYSELAAVAVVAALAATFEPRLRAPIVVAVVVGCGLAALLALAGVTGFTEGARNTSRIQTRLAGPFGNPNLLAFAIGFGIPAALAALRLRDTRLRLVCTACAVLCAVALALTFSRGGLLATAAGTATVLLLMHPRRSRARRLTGLALLVVAAAGAAAYPVFAQSRQASDTPTPDVSLKAIDVSGWDARRQGAIPRGPSAMSNPRAGVLEVRAGAGEGVSHPIGAAARGARRTVSFQARSGAGRERLSYALQDNLEHNGGVARTTRIGGAWSTLRIRWTPAAASFDARVYIWVPARPARFQVRAVVVAEGARGGDPTVAVPVSTRLRGTVYAEAAAYWRRSKQARDIDSRRIGIELAFRGFASAPLLGIGWGRFPAYAAARSTFGPLATHNEYLHFMVELGVLGVLLLGWLGVVITVAARRQRDVAGLAFVGMLVTGGVGLLFLNGLVASSVSLPLALAAGAACAGLGRPTGA